MGGKTLTEESYREARRELGVLHAKGVTAKAEHQAQTTGRLDEIVDPAINSIRRSLIRMNPHQKQWIVTVGCPMPIEVSCDTTGSMADEVDKEMKILPELYGAVSKVLPGYDPQLALGIFGDLCDRFALCRPQFEMEAKKIVNYLTKMVPCRDGGDAEEDSHFSMFASAYLTDAYINRIGLKGYHFIVTDAPCHTDRLNRSYICEVFGENIFENELKNMKTVPTMANMVKDLKQKMHQFILVVGNHDGTVDFWRDLCGQESVIRISTTEQLPAVISAIIGLTEGTLDITSLKDHLGLSADSYTFRDLSNIKIGAQAKLRHALPHPVPKKGDIFRNKTDLWPIRPDEAVDGEASVVADEHIEYL